MSKNARKIIRSMAAAAAVTSCISYGNVVYADTNVNNNNNSGAGYETRLFANNQRRVSENSMENDIYNALINLDDNMNFSKYGNLNSTQVFDTINKVLNENPEIFYVDPSNCVYWTDGRLEIRYPDSKPRIRQMMSELNQKVDYIMNTQVKDSMSDIEKLIAVHDYLVLNTVYTLNAPHQFDAYGVLVNGRGVCQGYAESANIILNKLGVKSIFVESRAMNHGWNIVTIDGQTYHFDATWDDPVPDRRGIVRYKYLALSDEEMSKDHTWDRNKYPRCYSKKYDFMKNMDFVVNSTDYIYYSDTQDFNIYKIRKDGSGKEKLVNKAAKPVNIEGNYLYYKDYFSGQTEKVLINNSNTENPRKDQQGQAQEQENLRRQKRQAQDEENARREQERKAQEQENARKEQERKAQEQENAKKEQERKTKEQENARREQERKAQDQENARKEQERKTKEQENARKEQERKTKEQENARKEQERKTKEQENARKEQERISQEQDRQAQQRKEYERRIEEQRRSYQRRIEEQRKDYERRLEERREQIRIANERREQQRKERERIAAERREQYRIQQEKQAEERENQRREQERVAKEREAEQRRQEQERQAEQRRQEQERQAEQKRQEQERQAEQKRQGKDKNNIAYNDGWLTKDGKKFFITNGQPTKGWFKDNNKWYFANKETGAIQTGWLQLGLDWYYFDEVGYMTTGWKKIDNKWRYFKEDGKMATGWLQYNSKCYYLGNYGEVHKGWQEIDKKWYRFKDSGEMQTGWYNQDNNWYYFDETSGQMATGWEMISGRWILFNNKGKILEKR